VVEDQVTEAEESTVSAASGGLLSAAPVRSGVRPLTTARTATWAVLEAVWPVCPERMARVIVAPRGMGL
jgi:hypothetical protein